MIAESRAHPGRGRELAQSHYPEMSFGGFSRVDGTVAFLFRAHALAPRNGRILDIGCGRGEGAEDPCEVRARMCDFRRPGVEVIGIDVDPGASANPLIDDFRLFGTGDPWPVETESVDLAISRSVIEHVEDIDAHFAELSRVLRIGGCFAGHTTNAWSYPGIASRALPNGLHARAISALQPGRQEQDVFPTRYRCNSVWRMRRALDAAGLEGTVFGIEAEPSYLQFSTIAYRIGVLAHALIPGCFRSRLVVFARKRG